MSATFSPFKVHRLVIADSFLGTGFPCVLENLGDKIFQVQVAGKCTKCKVQSIENGTSGVEGCVWHDVLPVASLNIP